jgi:PAS domain S-box-containing protein
MPGINEQLIDVSVLLVEDDTPSRIYCSKILKKLVREVFIAENGLEGLECFKQNKCDIIVSDIGMPVMDGLEMSREIKKIKKDVQIILTTALDNKNYLMQAIQIGINNYIVKPIQKENLYEAVEAASKIILLENAVNSQFNRIRKLSEVVEQSPIMVVIFDSLGIIEYCNQKVHEILGFEQSDIIGNSIDSLNFNKDFSNKYNELFNFTESQIIAGSNNNSLKDEFQAYKINNDSIWVSASITTLLDENDKLQNIVMLIEDITVKKLAQEELKKAHDGLELRVIKRTEELRDSNQKLLIEIETRKQTEEELIKAKEEAESANKAKSTFLAKVSHELRTPLNGIIGITSILLTDRITDKQKKFLEMVKSSADGLLDIINDILDFSKIEAGKLKLSETNFNLYKMIDQIIELYKHSAISKNLSLDYEISTNVPEMIYGDAGRIRQVLLNLISNALKFTDRGGIKVRIDLDSISDDTVILQYAVSDTGIGISDDKLDMLFKSFSQVDDSFTRKYGGTGLGLAISKEIVEMMEGSIWVESHYNVGSTFFFTSKLKIAQSNNISVEENQNTPSNNIAVFNLKLNILIAEDSLINQEVLKQKFKNNNWHVKTVDNGAKAVDAFINEKFDLIFMDIQMPEMDGIEATKMIRKYEANNNLQSVVIIGLTANAFDDQKNEALQIGMDDYVCKPFKFDELFLKIGNYFLNEINDINSTSETDDTIINVDIDINSLLDTLNNNKTILLKIIDYFLENIYPELNKLKNGINDNDYFLVRSIAHKMKSEVGNFSSFDTVEVCRIIENMGKDKDFSNIDFYIQKLNDKLSYLKIELENYKNNNLEGI